MLASERNRSNDSRFGLLPALAVSLVLHLLLLLFLWLFPGLLLLIPTRAAQVEEDVLRFSFAEPEEEAEEEILPEGEVPFETPQAQPQPDFEPGGLPSLQPPSSAGLPVPQLDPAEEESPEEWLEETPPEPIEEAVETRAEELSETGIDLSEGTRDPLLEKPPGEGSATDGPAEPSLDLNRALRDFSRAVATARAASPPTQSSTGLGRNVFTPDPANVPPTGFGVGQFQFHSADYDWTDYYRSFYVAVWKAWHRRLYYTTDEFEKWWRQTNTPQLDHVVMVRFVIQRNGDVTGIQVLDPSGCLPLDNSATDALDEVVLPRLPDDFPRDRETVDAYFLARGPIPWLRPSLERLKRYFLTDQALRHEDIPGVGRR